MENMQEKKTTTNKLNEKGDFDILCELIKKKHCKYIYLPINSFMKVSLFWCTVFVLVSLGFVVVAFTD